MTDLSAAALERLLAAATQFTFRPDYGHLNAMFSDDPATQDAVKVVWRGPAEVGGDPDRWAIVDRFGFCWGKSAAEFEFEVRSSDRDAAWLSDHRFTRKEALAAVPWILRAIEARRIPELRYMVQERAKRKAEQR